MFNIKIISRPALREYQYTLIIKNIKSQEVDQFVDRELFCQLCKEGCKNYARKWSCPPSSPNYCTISNQHKYLTVFILYMNLGQFSYVKNDYTKIKAANTMMKSRIDKFLRSKILNGKMISTGSCRLCRTCKMVGGDSCRHPDLMAYSFEALGVNVSAMTEYLCGHKLLWYSKGNLPIYTTVVSGLLTNQKLNINKLVAELQAQE